MKNKILLFLSLILLITFNSYAAIYYVDQGSINGPCSDSYTVAENNLTHPWCTIGRANQAHSGGDTINIYPGEYRDSLKPKSSLDSSHPTQYIGIGDRGQVKVLGSDQVTNWSQYNGSIYSAHLPMDFARCKEYATAQVEGNPACTPDPDFPWSYCYFKTTSCWEDGQRWYSAADLYPLDERYDGHYYDISKGRDDVDSPGKYFYDWNTETLYLRTFDDAPPSTHRIECAVRNTAWLSNYSPDEFNGYLTLENLTIMHSIGQGITLNSADGVNLIDNEFNQNTGSASCGQNPSAIYNGKWEKDGCETPETCSHTSFRITGNIVHNQGSDLGPFELGGWADGLKLYSIKDSVIANNEIYNVVEPLGVKRFNNGVTIRNNNIHNFTSYAITLLLENYNVLIDGNVAYNALSGGGTRNLVGLVGTSRNITLLHNTVWNISKLIGIDSSNSMQNNVRNNIAFTAKDYAGQGDGITVSGNVGFDDSSDFNLFNSFQAPVLFNWFGNGGLSLSNWRSVSGNDNNSQETDPLLLDPPVDFHLQSDSPAIDAAEFIPDYHCAVNYETDPDQTGCRNWTGAAPDIGAYEYGLPDSVNDQSAPNNPYDNGGDDGSGNWNGNGSGNGTTVSGGCSISASTDASPMGMVSLGLFFTALLLLLNRKERL